MKTEKTILHLTCMETTKYGGLEHYIIETARQCNKFGYKTVVQYGEYPRSSAYCYELNSLRINIVVLKLKLNPLWSARQLIQLIRVVRPDIIQTHFPSKFILFETPIIAKMLGVRRTIATVHSIVHISRKSIITRYAYNRYDRILCVSNAIAENLRYAGVKPNIISTHYLGVFEHVAPSEELRREFRNAFQIYGQDKVFACIAFDSPLKGLEVLLKSFKNVGENHSNVHLIIIGIDPDKSQLPMLAMDLGISGRVHWAGIRDEGWRVLNAADFYVQPSLLEGLSLATIEAMALKLPVVATRVGGQGEIVLDGETGYLCTPGDVDSLTQAMLKMLNQREGWARMAKAGYRRYMEMLRGEKSVETLIQNYYLV